MRLEEAAGAEAGSGEGGRREVGWRGGGGQRCKGHKHSCTETRDWARLQ